MREHSLHARDSRTPAGRCARAAGRAATVVSAALLICGFTAPQDSVLARDLGTWLTDDRKAKIELRECDGGSLCSEIVWLRDPVDENGEPWRDELNPDPSKRGRKVVGIDVLKGMEKTGENTWSGEIYDPEEGEYYYLKRLAVSEKRVELKGCLSTGWPCRTKYWTRTAPVNDEPARVANAEQGSDSGSEPGNSGSQRREGNAPGQGERSPSEPESRSNAGQRREAEEPQRERRRAAVTAQPQFGTESRQRPQSGRSQQREPEAQPRRQAAVPPPSQRPQPPAGSAAPLQQARQQDERTGQDQQRQQRQARRREEPSRADLPWRDETETARRRPRTTTGSVRRRQTPRNAPESGGYHVQVTAEQDHNAALRRFANLQQRFPSLLGGYLPNVQRVDLGARGVWFRVRVGPMQRRTAAVNLCEQLKAAGGDCLIRRD